MARKAYAISDNGKAAFMFNNKALRDVFVTEIDGYAPCTAAEYHKIEKKSNDSVDEYGNTVRYSHYNVFDMSCPDYWCDGWEVAYYKAEQMGII